MSVTLVTFAIENEARPFRRVQGVDIRVIVTGMGPRNAERSLREAMAAFSPERVLTCGFAGGLNPDLSVGTVVFEADEEFDRTPALRAVGARPGRFHCSGRVIARAAEKGALREATGADAVEMESGVIRAICRERGVPSATVRVISDAANEDLPLDFNGLLDAEARLHPRRILAAVSKRPWRIPRLIRLGLHARRAAQALANVLRVLGAG